MLWQQYLMKKFALGKGPHSDPSITRYTEELQLLQHLVLLYNIVSCHRYQQLEFEFVLHKQTSSAARPVLI